MYPPENLDMNVYSSIPHLFTVFFDNSCLGGVNETSVSLICISLMANAKSIFSCALVHCQVFGKFLS